MRLRFVSYIFKKKLHSGEREVHKPQSRERKSYKRNRRLFERYNVNQQHLTVLNDQDIFVVRDISAKGFSSDVSPRAMTAFKLVMCTSQEFVTTGNYMICL